VRPNERSVFKHTTTAGIGGPLGGRTFASRFVEPSLSWSGDRTSDVRGDAARQVGSSGVERSPCCGLMFATGSPVYPRMVAGLARRGVPGEAVALAGVVQRARAQFAGVVADTDGLIVDDVGELASRPPLQRVDGRPRASTKARQGTSTGSGGSPDRTPSAERPSGAARAGSASPRAGGSRPTVSMPSCPARRPLAEALQGRAAVEREFGRLKNEGGVTTAAGPWA
jgi:hypothetical protein